MFEPPKQFHNEDIEKEISNALISARSREDRRTYLGASRWGHHCTRALGYEFHATERDDMSKPQFSADLYRVFDMGHDGEDRMAQYLRLAGFEIATEKPGGGQIGFSACDGKLGGHCDGIVHAGPGITKAPLVWENKALNNKSWNDTKAKGVRVSKPLYYAQMQTYIGYLELEGYLFTAMNRDTGEVFVELGDPDLRTIQEVSDKALRIVDSDRPEQLPRCTATETDWQCRFCDFKKRCWGKLDKPATELGGIKFTLGVKQRAQ